MATIALSRLIALGAACFGLCLGGCRPQPLPDNRPIPAHPLVRYHKPFSMAKPWRLTAQGVEIRRQGHPRTKGKPITAQTIWAAYHRPINRWAAHYKVPAELIVATIALEGKQVKGSFERDPGAVREESGYVSDWKTPGRLAVGLTQITLATARAVLGREGISPETVDRQWLQNIDNNIHASVAYMAYQGRGWMSNKATLLDPPVAFAAYNSGGVYRMGGRNNPWKLQQYPSRSGAHVTRGVAWFNDAVTALRGNPERPAYSYYDYLAGLDAWDW